MAALDDLNSAVADVSAYVNTLREADLTPGIEAATTALRGLLPAVAPASTGTVDPTTGLTQ
jgi:hypothetical protein